MVPRFFGLYLEIKRACELLTNSWRATALNVFIVSEDQHMSNLEMIKEDDLSSEECIIAKGGDGGDSGESGRVMRGDRETKLRPAGQTLAEKSIQHHPFHPPPLPLSISLSPSLHHRLVLSLSDRGHP